MIAELMRSYRGVLCRRCRQPIPVSAMVVRLQEEGQDREPDVNSLHAFVARCRACEYESVYAITDIQTFDGEPRKRRLKALTASP